MTARRITVRSDPIDGGYHVWFYVFVYDTIDELRKAAKIYTGTVEDGNFHDTTLACFQPRYTVRYDSKGKTRRCANTKFLGVMRLTTERLDPGIIIHECVHAATNYLRVLRLSSRYLIGDNIQNEEAFAFAVQEFSYALLKHFEVT